MKRIPILKEFGGNVIGFMELSEQHIPTHGNWCFAIGGLASLIENGAKDGDIPNKPIIGEFELREVSIVTDAQYAAYLKQTGVL